MDKPEEMEKRLVSFKRRKYLDLIIFIDIKIIKGKTIEEGIRNKQFK